MSNFYKKLNPISMLNSLSNKWRILILSISFLSIVYIITISSLHSYYTIKMDNKVVEHGTVIASSMWQMDPYGISDYLNLACENNNYKNIVIKTDYDEVFIKIEKQLPNRFDRLLAFFNLIHVISFKKPIFYEDEQIGWIEVEWYCKAIYTFFYIFVILILLLITLSYYLRLKEREFEYRSLYETSLIGLWKIRISDGIFIKANTSTAKIFGYSDFHELQNNCKIDDLFVKKDRLDLIRLLKEKQHIIDYELHLKLKNGIEKDISISATIYPDQNYIEGAMVDITDRKKTEADLFQSRQMLRHVLDTIPQRLFWKDINLVYLGCNAKFAVDAGIINPEEIVGKTDYDLAWKKEEANLYRERDQKIIESEVAEYHVIESQLKSDKTESWLDTSKVPLYSIKGNVVGVLGIYEDITDRKKYEKKRLELEKELSRSRKLESIGTLAAGIAHEINTPIQFISDSIQFISDSLSELLNTIHEYRLVLKDSNLDKKVEEIETNTGILFIESEIPQAINLTQEGIDRISTIVSAMKDFSHLGSTNKAQEDINKALESTIIISRNEWKYIASMETDLDPKLPLVNCVIGEIKQVVLNLIINASHSIKDNLATCDKNESLITIRTYNNDKSVIISVTDTGTGIPEEIQDRIFDPFFTTKELGQGTGQGLSIAYQVLVEKHSAKIWFETEQGKGTTFYIELPVD